MFETKKSLAQVITMGAFLLSLIGASSYANAGLLIEPYAGYYGGRWTQGDKSSTFSGPGFGGRLGLSFLFFEMGLDGMMRSATDLITPQNDIQSRDLGVFVGIDFPILLRVYATYIPIARSTHTDSASVDRFKGTGFKAGLGLSPLPLLSINFEYMSHTFDKTDGKPTAKELTQKTYGVSISLPLDL